jgi:hypothetical protein
VSLREPQIDWNAATMPDTGMLSVPVVHTTDEWRDEFKKQVVEENLSFGSNGWGEIFLIGDQLVVRDIMPGSEQRLRNLLEAMVRSAHRAARREVALRETALEELKMTLLTRAAR